ncbi:putative WD repeat-containing protein sll0163 [Synechocystis sp, PCC 6803 substr. Kazusa] [Rhizoctonia solani]|uniref:Putative WD repeat-containing protein sll0163 [Synechocystis sp, PCC 6803 substr. Kazusa] n=1 Tax=Rhizoctonia solani TaxID=456999 RepID=A0A0K6GGY6_9AGAM|nr:putative WD repeat-containing protein sll0163 [Synechocystis sp, PCC 6803 substr. Kazusa] [Rhizoctonia solani]
MSARPSASKSGSIRRPPRPPNPPNHDAYLHSIPGEEPGYTTMLNLHESDTSPHRAIQPSASTPALAISTTFLGDPKAGRSVETAAKIHKEYQDIAAELETLSLLVAQYMEESKSFRLSNCVANVANLIIEQAELIKHKHDRGLGSRLIEAQDDQQDLVRCYRRIEALFRQLQIDIQLSMWDTINEHLMNIRLDGLGPARLATYDSTLSTEINRCFCTAGTRYNVLSQLDDWSRDSTAPNLYWMNGMAGTGKTTIATSFSRALEDRKQLAASFFCTVASPECRQVKRIIPSVSYQLARYSMPFQRRLCEILASDPDIHTKNISKQFEWLLKEPLASVKEAIPDNLVVVIDALDECDDLNGVELLLNMIFKHIHELPLKFFVTSRPKPDIYHEIFPQSPNARAVFHLHDIESLLVRADIETYIKAELDFVSPTEEQIETLVQRSGNLFIYAATLIRYIRLGKRSSNPHKRFKSALEMISKPDSVRAEIDSLYISVLESALDEEGFDADEVEDSWLVLWTVLCAQEPISVTTLSTLSGLDDFERTSFALQSLRSVIHYSESTGLISTLHASFPDFMFDKGRSGRFFCDTTHHHQLLTKRCFQIMNADLKFNICDLESSFVPDRLVEDIEERIQRNIPSSLYYACRYWGEHLHHAVPSAELETILTEFISTKLLFWMEVLNLNQIIPMAAESLLKALIWLQQNGRTPSELDWFIEDSRNFVNSFAANPVSQATPHIYISMLPFCPKSTSVSQQYFSRTRSLMDTKGNGMQSREAAALATWRIGSSVHSVAYSPEGVRVAFGCADGTIGVKNVYDGLLVVGPIEAHTDCVACVDFSPDGTRIVSCSKDSTIRIWNAQDGTPVIDPIGTRLVAGYQNNSIEVWACDNRPVSITGPLKGHLGAVKSVAFSPDGDRIVSGSDDNTIRIWNTGGPNGAYTSRVLEGHTGSVSSVVFSSDGKRIASGSDDHTVRVWDALNGEPVIDPIEGHTSRVTCISFSPDGTRIASCSCDQTIRVWNATKGLLVDGLFEGHTGYILCIIFSPDGTRMASGSEDCTIRLWNISETGLVILPSAGHIHRVNSIAVSPDGARLVSGSHDHTVRIWDIREGRSIQDGSKLLGHTDVVWSVAFSSDNRHVASGSADRTVRIWDIHDGSSTILEGHTDTVQAVSFSPDGTRLVSGSSDRTVRVWDILKRRLILPAISGHNGVVTSVAFSSNGLFIVSGSLDSTVRIWDAQNGMPISGPFLGHIGDVTSVTFSPSSRAVISGSSDCTIRLWDISNGALLTEPFKGHASRITSVASSPDGNYIITGSDDCTVKIWRIDGTLVKTLYGHTDAIQSVTFSPDGLHIVSASWDQNIRIWDTPTTNEYNDRYSNTAKL